ncbi:cell envelope integrity protein CreD [Flavobacterium sp. GT3R68]|uniref:cell envelope integrity protein CreD n=1 Tax=Flavobacterium sp. GT3R68 TaxID=2594437 RepID=UPI000F8668B3|nr:cell envelope integrity protein CreD [Flavobacterium sp. GT3R68]RTY89101.1 cell envelope integrity protein CreD [Flavobacterium sp. GSN2]TRW90101.1 cell envelope integrity protein CreD [Flavobacterium sp. GT3R68]
MENNENQNPISFFQSNTAKIIMVGLLTLILLIPLEYVKNLISERAQRQKEVIAETNDKWGGNIFFYGPILKVPYTYFDETLTENATTKVTVKQKTAHTAFAYFFPEMLKAKSDVTTKALNRNNYESVVFSSKMKLTGHYIQPNFSNRNIPNENIQWDKATILIKTTNLKSIKDEVKINFGNINYTFEPVYNITPGDSTEALETGYIDLTKTLGNQKTAFNIDITYNGSKQIKMVPIGKTTGLNMKSNWASPSFTGNFLPDDKTKHITKTGFEANWKILHINRAFAQQVFETLPDLKQYAFGVDFVIPVDQYQQNERASKYGFLVIGLTFLIFFLIQSISKINIHIFQYSMIGLALIMFYTLLISITEHSSFMKAYAIAGISVVVLITLYSISILKDRKFPLFIGLSLSALYTFIYVIIQLENYALLVGSIGLFLILAAVMYFSRKIDWSTGNS